MTNCQPTSQTCTNAARVAREMASRLIVIAERIESAPDPVDDIDLIRRVGAVLRDNRRHTVTVARALVLEALHRAHLGVQLVDDCDDPRHVVADPRAVTIAMDLYGHAVTSARRVPLDRELWAALMSAWTRPSGRPRKEDQGLRGGNDMWETLASLLNRHLPGVREITGDGLKSNWHRWQRTPDHLRRPRSKKSKRGARGEPGFFKSGPVSVLT